MTMAMRKARLAGPNGSGSAVSGRLIERASEQFGVRALLSNNRRFVPSLTRVLRWVVQRPGAGAMATRGCRGTLPVRGPTVQEGL